ncbi:hypothetical protein H257_07106 [Aphanomyces astaci]|uniref:Uncharacterized protein n=1 Tax=Aphanomyces astaci TaxID=112090 RepID=W4GLX0_APHAT|nr:hypothetical protein H257_07106 [Aphanomyces astaci]ETV79898.1 hypothetical protein H257_07106 [Aphanomyces astaci]|eukprot:XP_009830834.1 hypothetical protein H257_07106 [Aphanomyces astaci]
MPNHSSEPKTRQEKKGNKAKRSFELHGKYSAKHTRRVEAFTAQHNAAATSPHARGQPNLRAVPAEATK